MIPGFSSAPLVWVPKAGAETRKTFPSDTDVSGHETGSGRDVKLTALGTCALTQTSSRKTVDPPVESSHEVLEPVAVPGVPLATHPTWYRSRWRTSRSEGRRTTRPPESPGHSTQTDPRAFRRGSKTKTKQWILGPGDNGVLPGGRGRVTPGGAPPRIGQARRRVYRSLALWGRDRGGGGVDPV